MKVTRRADAALRAAVGLAQAPAGGPVVSVADLSRRSGVPAPFLQQVLLRLRRAGIVASRGGRRGGYRLARDPGAISVGDVLRGIQPDLAPMPCAGDRPEGACPDAAGCRVRPVWVRVRRATDAVIDATSLRELCA